MSASPQQPDASTMTPAGQGFLRRTFQAFRYKNFRLMWAGAFTSTTGAFVQEVAQSWLVYELTNDPFLLGLTVFLNNAPILLLSLAGGVAADRMDRRKLLIGSQLMQMASAVALALQLTGVVSNRSAVGARCVAVTYSGREIHRQVRVGNGFANTDSPIQHFGIGSDLGCCIFSTTCKVLHLPDFF